MGIQGLLPFVQKACKPVNISDYSGCSVAVDGNCWLYKAAYGCAEKIVKGEKTTQHVSYCIRFIEMLKHHKIKPVIVFDGNRLPAKREIHDNRREKRQSNLSKAAECERNGDMKEARVLYGQSYTVTPEMVSDVIQACRNQGVDCLVAPFEADAQLAYLLSQGYVNLVITEDSDLIAFGCKRILFKLDFNGRGLLYERRLLYKCLSARAELLLSPSRKSDDQLFTRFRYGCILAGCDYLCKGLSGIGLQKAMKAVLLPSNVTSIERMLARLPQALGNMHIRISEEFKEAFVRANSTFLYQIVFDPTLRRQVHLNELSADVLLQDLSFTGAGLMSDSVAFLLSLGFLKANNLTKEDEQQRAKSEALVFIKSGKVSTDSIWSSKFAKPSPLKSPARTPRISRRATIGEIITVDLGSPLKIQSQPVSQSEESSSEGNHLIRRTISDMPNTDSCKRKLAFEDQDVEEIDVSSSPFKKRPEVWSAPVTKKIMGRRSFLPPISSRKLNAREQLAAQKVPLFSDYFAPPPSVSPSASQESRSSSARMPFPPKPVIVDEDDDVEFVASGSSSQSSVGSENVPSPNSSTISSTAVVEESVGSSKPGQRTNLLKSRFSQFAFGIQR